MDSIITSTYEATRMDEYAKKYKKLLQSSFTATSSLSWLMTMTKKTKLRKSQDL